jgi:hypothetical protein
MLAFLTRQLRAFAPMFRPPFDGLWLAILLYFFWCFLVHPGSQILRGNLPDPDDYMYLDQVLDWIKGQGWFDSIQHRLDPPAGGPIHFSRLPQIPMALLTLFFEAFGLPPNGAATLMAIIEPLFLLAGFLVVIRWLARSFMPQDWTGVTAYIALFQIGLLSMFMPGHVDHHGLVMLLTALALGCSVRMLAEPEKLRWGLGAGFILALNLTIALEVLPWVIIISGWLGLWAMAEGGKAARNGLVYGLTLYLASAAFLLISRPPDLLLVPDVAVYSLVYIFFTGGIAASFAGIALGARSHRAWRWVLGAGIAAVTGAMFLARFPDLDTGPWGGVDPALAKLILDNVTEAAPLYKLEHSWLKFAIACLGTLIAFSANVRFLRSAKGRARWIWGLLAALLATAFLLTVFYQFRFIGGLDLFAIPSLAVLLQRGWERIGRQWRGRRKVFAEIALLLLVGPLPAVLVPALADGRSFNAGVLLFPATSETFTGCDMYQLEQVLRSPQLYIGRPRVIMNTMGLGPELMFRTTDKVISAPYHEDVAGNLDAVRFFSTTDPVKAETIARQRHVDLVVVCMMIPGMYTNLTTIREALPDTGDGAKQEPGGKSSPPFILQLLSGANLPKWLKPIRSPRLHNYVVYEITPPRPHARKRTDSE